MLIHSAEITGSVQFNNTDVSGITNVSGFATTASVNSLVVKTGSYASTSSVNDLQSKTGSYASTSSVNELQSKTGSYTSTSSFGAYSSSINTFTSSATTRLNTIESVTGSYASTSSVNNLQSVTGSYASTGSNQFNGNQSISGSITSNGTITAQTLVVQTVTSSIEFVTGSTRNGSIAENTHQFTGSVLVSGSLNVGGAINLGPSALFPTVGLFNRTSDTTLYMVTAPTGFTLLDNSQNTMYGATPTSHIWNISNSEKMRINSSGSVGIGTSSPTGTYGKLSVAGGISILNDNNAKLEIGRYSSGVPNSYIKLGANSDSLRITNNNDSADIFTITNTGNVGIGTTSPSGSLHIIGTNATNRGQLSIQSNNASNAARVSFYYDTTLQGNVGTTSGDFYVEAVNNLVLLSGGNVGVGIYSPAAKLDVNGSVGHNNGSNFKAFEFFKTISASTSATNLYTVTLNTANRAVFYEVIVFGADWSGHSAARTIKRGFFCPNGSYTAHNVVESSGIYASNITLGYSQSGNAFTTTLTLYAGASSLDCHIRIVGDIASYS